MRTLLIRRRSTSSTSTLQAVDLEPLADGRHAPDVRQQVPADGLEPLALDLRRSSRCATSSMSTLPLKTNRPSPSSTIGSDSTSYSSRISPTISSSRSSMVTSPAVPPYSSTTIAHCVCWRWNCFSSSGTRLLSGTTTAGRSSAVIGRASSPASSATRSFTNTKPAMLSRLSLKTGNREYSCSRNSARRSPMVASSRMRDDVGARRHDLADQRVAEVDDALQQPALLAFDDPFLLARCRCTPWRPRSPPPPLVVRGGRRAARLAPAPTAPIQRVIGPSTRATGLNDGSRSSSTRSGSRPTISSGSSSSQTTTKPATLSDDQRSRRAPSTPMARASSAVAVAGDEAEQQPHRDEQQQRIVEVVGERAGAAAPLGRRGAATAASAR